MADGMGIADVYEQSSSLEGVEMKLLTGVEAITIREDQAKRRGETVPAGKSVDQREAEAWLAYAEGKPDAAIEELRSAADRQESEHAEPMAQPAREMLGDMFL